MGDVKPWHAVVIVLGLLGLGLGGFVTMRNSGPVVSLAKTMVVADVVTGDLYEIPIPHGIGIPAKNPKTGTATLFPVVQSPEGAWVIPARYRSCVLPDPKPLAVKDMKSGEVAVVSGSPSKISLK